MSTTPINVTQHFNRTAQAGGAASTVFEGTQADARRFVAEVAASVVSRDGRVLPGKFRLARAADGTTTVDASRGHSRVRRGDFNQTMSSALEMAYGTQAREHFEAYLSRTGGRAGTHSLVALVKHYEPGIKLGPGMGAADGPQGADWDALLSKLTQAQVKADARIKPLLKDESLQLPTGSAARQGAMAREMTGSAAVIPMLADAHLRYGKLGTEARLDALERYVLGAYYPSALPEGPQPAAAEGAADNADFNARQEVGQMKAFIGLLRAKGDPLAGPLAGRLAARLDTMPAGARVASDLRWLQSTPLRQFVPNAQGDVEKARKDLGTLLNSGGASQQIDWRAGPLPLSALRQEYSTGLFGSRLEGGLYSDVQHGVGANKGLEITHSTIRGVLGGNLANSNLSGNLVDGFVVSPVDFSASNLTGSLINLSVAMDFNTRPPLQIPSINFKNASFKGAMLTLDLSSILDGLREGRLQPDEVAAQIGHVNGRGEWEKGPLMEMIESIPNHYVNVRAGLVKQLLDFAAEARMVGNLALALTTLLMADEGALLKYEPLRAEVDANPVLAHILSATTTADTMARAHAAGSPSAVNPLDALNTEQLRGRLFEAYGRLTELASHLPLNAQGQPLPGTYLRDFAPLLKSRQSAVTELEARLFDGNYAELQAFRRESLDKLLAQADGGDATKAAEVRTQIEDLDKRISLHAGSDYQQKSAWLLDYWVSLPYTEALEQLSEFMSMAPEQARQREQALRA